MPTSKKSVSKARANNSCSYCDKCCERFELTGMKVIANERVPYQLCASCCSIVRGLSSYTPSEVKIRQDFWDNLWKRLAETADAA